MANAEFEVRRVTFDLSDPDGTWVEVECGPTSDGTLGVEGVHRREFPRVLSPEAREEVWAMVRSLDFLTGDGWTYRPAAYIARMLALNDDLLAGKISREEYIRRMTNLSVAG
jgi:hypothetical protein